MIYYLNYLIPIIQLLSFIKEYEFTTKKKERNGAFDIDLSTKFNDNFREC